MKSVQTMELYPNNCLELYGNSNYIHRAINRRFNGTEYFTRGIEDDNVLTIVGNSGYTGKGGLGSNILLVLIQLKPEIKVYKLKTTVVSKILTRFIGKTEPNPDKYTLLPTNGESVKLIDLELGSSIHSDYTNTANMYLISKDPLIVAHHSTLVCRFSEPSTKRGSTLPAAHDTRQIKHREYKYNGLLPDIKGIRTKANYTLYNNLDPYIRSVILDTEIVDNQEHQRFIDRLVIPHIEDLGGEIDAIMQYS